MEDLKVICQGGEESSDAYLQGRAGIAKTYHGIAGILVHQGKLDQAVVLCQASLDMKWQLHGSKDSSMAETLQRIAMVLRDQDKLDESIRFYWRSRIMPFTKTTCR